MKPAPVPPSNPCPRNHGPSLRSTNAVEIQDNRSARFALKSPAANQMLGKVHPLRQGQETGASFPCDDTGASTLPSRVSTPPYKSIPTQQIWSESFNGVAADCAPKRPRRSHTSPKTNSNNKASPKTETTGGSLQSTLESLPRQGLSGKFLAKTVGHFLV